jgi:hypothetical protein
VSNTTGQRLSPEPQSELTAVPRPPAAAFVLGAVLIAMIGGSIAILFLFNHSSLALALASVGIVVNLVGLGFLIYGNDRRIRLIIKFGVRAAELMRASDKAPAELLQLEKALLRLRAYDQALEISRWRVRDLGEPKSKPDSAGE